jgi:membrane-associated phospholipid phosphatase
VVCPLAIAFCLCISLVAPLGAQDYAASQESSIASPLEVSQATGSVAPQNADRASPSVAEPPAAAATAGATAESSSSAQAAQPTQPAQAVQPALTGRDVSERTVFTNILHDQKDLWLFPLKMSRENHWLPTVIVAGVTAGLLATDAQDAPFFRQTRAFNDFDHAFASNISMTEVLIAPASFYAVGLLDKDPYARKTGLFAGEALVDVTILSEAIKAITRQTRPQAIPPYGNFSDTFFNAKGDPLSSSFPSGHTISAFAVATVIAERYQKRHWWVPLLAYGAASVIGFSRVTTQAHFPSDVFLGAALGYGVARFDVLQGWKASPDQ